MSHHQPWVTKDTQRCRWIDDRWRCRKGDDDEWKIRRRKVVRPPERLSIPTLFNTGQGLQPGPGGPLQYGMRDVHYEHTSAEYVGWVSAYVGGSGFWYQGGSGPSGSTWVAWSYHPYHRLRTTFDLTRFDPATVVLLLEILVDGILDDVLLNGVSQGITLGQTRGLPFNPFTISSGFQSGINKLEFVYHRIQNSPSATGIRIQASGTGIYHY